MNKRKILFFLCFFSVIQAQEVRYITDMIEVPLRTGSGGNYRIIHLLKSGDVVTWLDSEDTWAKVQYKEKTGWVPQQYLVMQLIMNGKNIQTDTVLQEKINQQKNRNLLQSQKDTIKRLEKDNKEMFVEKNKIESELSNIKKLSGNLAELQKEKETLLIRIVNSENKLQLAENFHSANLDQINRNWVFIMITIAIFFLFLGFFAQVLRGKILKREESKYRL